MSEHVEQQPIRVPAGRLDPFWWGAVALAMFAVGGAISLSYDFCDFAWQQRLGGWNLWLGAACMVGTVVPLRLWTTSAHKA